MPKQQVGNIGVLDIGDKPETVTNPFSGASCELEPVAVAVYDLTKGAEMMGNYEIVEKCLAYFSKNYPSQYMTLLD